MIILDTNVISALMRAEPDKQVVEWLDDQPRESVWTTSISVFEILYGLNILPNGKRQKTLRDAFVRILHKGMDDRVFHFDMEAAREASSIAAKLRKEGKPIEIRDVQIAGIVAARRGVLSTRNTKHFIDADVPLIDPWAVE